MNYWLMKSEPDVFSFDDLRQRPRRTEPWNGVRNYQARNFMRDAMIIGDRVLFYHSNAPVPGIAGLARIASQAYPDPTQFDPASEYFDPKSTPENPRWLLVDVAWDADLPRLISLKEIRETPELQSMLLIRKGQRLSIQPVTELEFRTVLALGSR